MGRGRAPCCEKVGLKKGSWTPAEDMRLIVHIHKHGHGNWRTLPQLAGLQRCGKSCRLRWMNYLRPDIRRGNFTKEEEDTIINLHQMLGKKWSKIASYLPGRTDNEIKNVWNTHLKKRLGSTEKNKEPPSSPSYHSSVSSCCQSGSVGSGVHRADEETSRVRPESSADDFVEIPTEASVPEMWDAISSSAHDNATETDLSMFPELWDLFDEDSPSFNPDIEVDNKTWIAYLERELDLPQTTDAPAAVEDYVGAPDAEKGTRGGAMDAEIDPVATFFSKRPRSPSPFSLSVTDISIA